jgi:hypothetical protein
MAELGRRAFLTLAGMLSPIAVLRKLGPPGVAQPARTPAHLALEQEIITAWYTGTYEVDGRRQLATHTGALMWSALGRPAPGLCAGAGSSWSQPPPATAL